MILSEERYVHKQDMIADYILDEVLRKIWIEGLTLAQYLNIPHVRKAERVARELAEGILFAAGIEMEEDFDVMGEDDWAMPDCHP